MKRLIPLAVCTALLATVALPAAAECSMDIPKSWRLRQDNGYTIRLKTTKVSKGNYKANVTLNNGLGGLATGRYGSCDFRFDIFWDNGSTGFYELSPVADGVLRGRTCDYNTRECVGIRTLTDFNLTLD